jgi:hypothetical protein
MSDFIVGMKAKLSEEASRDWMLIVASVVLLALVVPVFMQAL